MQNVEVGERRVDRALGEEAGAADEHYGMQEEKGQNQVLMDCHSGTAKLPLQHRGK